MKKEITAWTCDRCGKEMNANGAKWHLVEDGEYAYIGLRAMFTNAGVGDKYDLCKKCTIKLAKQFIEKAEKENGK